MNSILRLWLLASAAAICGCENSTPPSEQTAPPARTEIGAPYLSHAQPRLQTMELWVGPERVTAELALTRTEIATGMMHRTEMGKNEGMLFVFPAPMRASFYMKNTRVPLSCAYIDSEGKILEIHRMQPLDETPIQAASNQVQFVLEMRQGWFEDHGVRVGMSIATEQGPLRESLFQRRSR